MTGGWGLVIREDRKEFCHPDRVGAGAGTEDTEMDWTGTAGRMGTLVG